MRQSVTVIVLLFAAAGGLPAGDDTVAEANKALSVADCDGALRVYAERIARPDPPLEVTYEYGMLLARLGEVARAKEVLQGVLDGGGAGAAKERMIADFLFYFGNLEAAGKTYAKVARESEDNDGPSRAWSTCGLGKIALVKGNFDEAEKLFTSAAEQKFAPNCARNSDFGARLARGMKAIADWPIVETGNFVFHVSPNVKDLQNKVWREKFCSERQKAFEQTCETLKVKIEGVKIRFLVFLDDKEAVAVNGIGAHYSETSWWMLFTAYGQSVGHEMTHQISARIGFGQPASLLLCEGVCVCFDRNPGTKHEKVRELVHKKEMPGIAELDADAAKYDYYPIGGSLVRFLIDAYGMEKFRRLWVRFDLFRNAERHRGNPRAALDSLCTEVCGKGLAVIEDEWLKAAK
jgi:hypothetical protein